MSMHVGLKTALNLLRDSGIGSMLGLFGQRNFSHDSSHGMCAEVMHSGMMRSSQPGH